MKKILTLENWETFKAIFRTRLTAMSLVVLVLAVVTAGVYATNGHKPESKTPLAHNHAVLAASSTPKPSATPSPTGTPTPLPKPDHPTTAKAVVSSVPKIALVPMGPAPSTTAPVPSPTPSQIVITPELENWYFMSAKNGFTAIWENFGYMEYYANENNITEIENVCWQFGEIGQQGLRVQTAPDATVDAAWRSNMNELIEGSTECQDGINNNDSDTATNGLDLLENAGISLKQLQGQLNPSDAAQIDTIIANAAISG